MAGVQPSPRWRRRSHVKPQQTRECFQKVLFHGDTITPTDMKANTMNLSLLRSPEVPTGCSPEPLRNRVQSRLDLLKPKVTRAPPSLVQEPQIQTISYLKLNQMYKQ